MFPDSSYNFLAWVLQPNDQQEFSLSSVNVETKLEEFILNMTQDYLYHINNNYSPKHVGIPIYMHTLTRNKSLIQMVESYGVSVSYDTLRRIMATIANKVQEREDGSRMFIPANIPGVVLQFAMDNLDFVEHCIDEGTTHTTSSVICQRQELCSDYDNDQLNNTK